MKYFSLFSGIGGFELGIKQAYDIQNILQSKKRKHEEKNPTHNRSRLDDKSSARLGDLVCVGYSEIDKYAIQTYQSHFKDHKNYGDITKINEKELPDFDILVGGFPCQSFSIAGKRKGFEDTRGTLFFDIARILQAKQPRLFVLENVKGLLSHNNGSTFSRIIETLDELGYDLGWQVLNSKNHGVPQNRERVFIIGHFRGTPRPKVFPFGQDSGTTDGVSGQHSNTLTTRYYGGQANGTYVIESELDAQKEKKSFIKQSSRGFNKGGEHDISPTIGSSSWQQNNHVDGIRRLTPIECERLQGFPDNWTAVVSDSQRYKQCGNAVTVNVIKDIFEKIFQSLI